MKRETIIIGSGAAVLITLVLLWGTSPGQPLFRFPSELIPDFDPPTPTPEPSTFAPTPTGTPTAELQPPGSGLGLSFLRWIFYALLAGVAILLLGGLTRLLSRRQEPAAEPDEEELRALLEATSEQRRENIRVIGEPRNAVVACWIALEDAVERTGLTRDPAKTSTEFTAAVLERWDVPPPVIQRLASAFRAARFSEHPVSESQRDDAITALERINAVLTARQGTDPADAESGAGDSKAEPGRGGTDASR